MERGFPDFHNFCFNSGKPIATVLVSAQERCRLGRKVSAVDPDSHVVVIYHTHRATLAWLTSHEMLSFLQDNRVESTTFPTHPALPSSAIFSKYGANRLLACRADTKGNDSSRIVPNRHEGDDSTRFDRTVKTRDETTRIGCISWTTLGVREKAREKGQSECNNLRQFKTLLTVSLLTVQT